MVIALAAPTRMATEEREAVRAAVSAVLAGDRWVGGPVVESFESAFAAYLGGGHVVGVGNGSDALGVSLLALGLREGDRVLVPPHDGGFAAQAAASSGLAPVSYDLDPSGLPSVATLDAAYDPRARAVVVTHLHGDPLDLADVDSWRRERDLLLVEDCAQAHGARVAGRHVGLVGDAAAFSFYPTKNLGAMGDAGAVVARDGLVADRARALREYGWGAERYRVDHPRGRNSRLDTVQAAVLEARLGFLDARNERRREIARRYAEALDGGPARLGVDPEAGVVHHAVVRCEDRDGLRRSLLDGGVPTAVHYPYLCTEMPGLTVPGPPTPEAARRRDRILTLPCHPQMRDDEVAAVVDGLLRWSGAA